MRQKAAAPSQLLKFPEIFCWTFIILKSLSAKLLSNRTSKSYMKAKTCLRYLSNLSGRFCAIVFFFFPRFLMSSCELEMIGGGFSSLPLSINVIISFFEILHLSSVQFEMDWPSAILCSLDAYQQNQSGLWLVLFSSS